MWKMHPNRGFVSPLSMHFRRVAHIPRSLRQWRSVASPNASKTETSWGKAAQSELSSTGLAGANAGPGTQAPRRPHCHHFFAAHSRFHLDVYLLLLDPLIRVPTASQNDG